MLVAGEPRAKKLRASLPRSTRYLTFSGAALSLLAVGVPGALWHLDGFALLGVGAFETVLMSSAGVLAVAVCILVVGLATWLRNKDAPSLIPLRTPWHIVALLLPILLVLTLSVRISYSADEHGAVEEILGWPAPMACRSAQYSGTRDNTRFCCSRDGDFSLDHFLANRELYTPGLEEMTWDIIWPLAIANALFALIAAFSATHGVERLLSSVRADDGVSGGVDG